MRFFVLACLVCVSIASVGCMTHNWSLPLFKKGPLTTEEEAEKAESDFWNTKFGEASGTDARARAIEKRLGL